MALRRCDWSRFWHPRGGRAALGSDGFLWDPESALGRSVNSQLLTAEQISSHPCLVLLGDPGVGKSYAIEQFHSSAASSDNGSGQHKLINLRAYSTDGAICRAIFDAPWFGEWQAGGDHLELFLDSLDECRVRVPTVAALLAEELKNRPIGRLSLRIACRSAEWPETLEGTLKALWGKDGVGIVELAPLRRVDVEMAAAVHGLTPQPFLHEIVRCGVQSFAARPLTLELLIGLFAADGRLPERLTDLYERGLTRLCEETAERIDAGLRPSLSARQRLAVASRVAAGLVLGNRYAVSTESGGGESDDVPLADLIGGTEGPERERVSVGEAELRATLGTGLFTSSGVNRRSFAHQSYAEFLAARFLRIRLSARQRDSLISVSGEEQLCIPPQLEETVGWLASAESAIFASLLSRQPEVLVRGDVSTADPTVRSSIVHALLERLTARAIADWRVLIPNLWKLRHPELESQLRPLLVDKTLDREVRSAAIGIARECEASELSDDLASVALDQSDDYEVRVWAAHAVVRIGLPHAKVRFRALALGQAGPDPRDELRGCGLEATWPGNLTAPELFQCLVRPQDDHFLGIYRWYLHQAKFLLGLSAEDVPLALQWILDSDIGVEPTDDLRDCAHRILRHAWAISGNAAICRTLALVCLDRIRRYDDIGFGDRRENEALQAVIDADAPTRRSVINAVVENATPGDHLGALIFKAPSLVQADDLGWLLDRALSARGSEVAHWVELARLAFRFQDSIYLEQVCDAAQRSSQVAAAFACWLQPVQLDSPQAQEMRKRYLEEEERRREREPRVLEPPPAERVQTALARCLSEGPDHWWWQLCKELTLEPASTRHELLWEREIKASPGWDVADHGIRQRIVAEARQCIEHLSPEASDLVSRSMNEAEYASFRAFQLLLEEDREFIKSLGAAAWERWMPGIVGWPIGSEGKDTATHRELLALAYEGAADRFLELLQAVIAAENEAHSHIFILDKVEGFWGQRLAASLLDRVRRADLKPACFGILLRTLLRHGGLSAREVAGQWLSNPPPPLGTRDRDYSVEAACCLLEFIDREAWEDIWPIVNSDPLWGKTVFEQICHGELGGGFVVKLDEGQLGELLDWLFRHYSPATDPKLTGAHYVMPDESLRLWRDGLVRRLQERGTAAAEGELAKLRTNFPALPWLHWATLQAGKARQRRNWAPATPRQIVELAMARDRRFVASGSQLLDVLVESLERLQQDLHGETPVVEFLWDTSVRRPKSENSLSNFIKKHLERDLRDRQIIVGREVEIRSRTWAGGQPGEEVDLHVDVVSETGDRISAIIETKGCWHRKLKTAMQSQLIGRYLKNNQSPYGLYLVGWFLCDAWDDGDVRKGQTPFPSLRECKTYFREQARNCSTGVSADGEVRAWVLDCALR